MEGHQIVIAWVETSQIGRIETCGIKGGVPVPGGGIRGRGGRPITLKNENIKYLIDNTASLKKRLL